MEMSIWAVFQSLLFWIYVLRPFPRWLIRQGAQLCFNPCCSGSRPSDAVGACAGVVTAECLNPCCSGSFLDAPLPVCRLARPGFQSLLFWITSSDHALRRRRDHGLRGFQSLLFWITSSDLGGATSPRDCSWRGRVSILVVLDLRSSDKGVCIPQPRPPLDRGFNPCCSGSASSAGG